YSSLSMWTPTSGWSLIVLSSGFSVTRSTICHSVIAISRSQVWLVALQVPAHLPGLHAFAALGAPRPASLGQSTDGEVPGRGCSFHCAVSTVKVLSGRVRSKLVTSELMSPQPPTDRAAAAIADNAIVRMSKPFLLSKYRSGYHRARLRLPRVA